MSEALREAPKYLQLREAIRSMIRGQRLPPGYQLPPEGQLCEQFGASRGTVRRAFDDLERDGLVSREPGRGTFVAAPRMERPLPELTSFTEHIESLGMTPGAELVSFRGVTAETDGDGQFPVGNDLFRIVRVRTVDGAPVGLHTMLIPRELAEQAGVTAHALHVSPGLSVYRALAEIGVEVDLAEEHLMARRPTPQERRRLMLGSGDPVLEVLRQTYDITGRPIEFVRAAYRADRYDYTTWLRRPRSGG